MEVQEESVPLLTNGGTGLARRVWEESKKLWAVVGPSMIGRLALYGMCVITQAYAGHVGDLELASFSIATTVVASFAFGFMVCTLISLTSFGKEGKETHMPATATL